MRVVQVSFYADVRRRDGESLLEAWTTLPAVAAAVARQGVTVDVVQAGHADETLERDGVRFHFIDDDRAMPLRLFGRVPVPRRPSRLLDRIARLQPDVVHVHGLIYPLAVYQLARTIRGTPILLQDHAALKPRGWRGTVWRWTSRSLAGVAFTARQQANAFFDARAFRSDLPIFEIIEGSSTFTPGDRESARGATEMFGDPCMLWTGRLNTLKDPMTALAAFEVAAERLPDARLWCCFGEAPLLADVERYIDRSPVLRERVKLLGARPHAEMELRYRAADFYVQTSRREGSGYSLLEALACGTPPLVTDIPAARRIVGDVGSLTPVGDAAALAEAMVGWSCKDFSALRSAARDRFERELSFDAIGRNLRAAYETIANGHGRPPLTPQDARPESKRRARL